MGFNVLFDLIGSIIIGGVVLLMMGNVNESMVENTFNSNNEYRTQSNVTAVSLIIESDLRKIGYTSDYLNTADPRKSILLAHPSRIKFLYDYNSNGIMDTIEYYLGLKNELNSTSNPDDCFIYKRVNGSTPQRVADGVTIFNFSYYNDQDVIINSPVVADSLDNIANFELSVSVEPGEPVMGTDKSTELYPPFYMRQARVTSRNLYGR